jgi:acetoin utilization deacetylase AcuC-like enzyme
MQTYTSSIFYKHDTGVGHPESPRRMDAALEGVARAGGSLLRDLPLHPETDRIIAKVHSADYKRELEESCRAGMRLFHSLDNPISSSSFAAARNAVSLALIAADAVGGEAVEDRRAFVVARPPGHHAERVNAMGFCFFNTIACAAEYLRERAEFERLLIFDFDVHHGNGTQHLFESRDDVFYASMHRFPFYPGTGAAAEVGIGAGRGFTHNVPFSQGAGDAEYLSAVEDVIVPLIDDYRPDAILLSSGFDAHRRDPLGGMRVTEHAYGELTRRIVEASERVCNGRVLSLLEGGYDMEGLSASVAEHVLALSE